MADHPTSARFAALEMRVAALESDRSRDRTGPEPNGDTGVSSPASALTGIGVHTGVEVLAALGHPVRASIVRVLLATGPIPGTHLMETTGMSSTGQLYHHVRQLTRCGVVEQHQRGHFRINPRSVSATVAILAAAAVIGEPPPEPTT